MSGLLLVRRIHIEPNHSGEIILDAGEVARFTQRHGPQVIDVNLFSADDPHEHFWAGRTRTIEGHHLAQGDQLWSTEPWMRPMATVVSDSLSGTNTAGGARYHDLTFPRCSQMSHDMRCSVPEHRNCHDNLIEGMQRLGIDSCFIHDTLNIFMLTGLDVETDRSFVEATDTSESDHFDLRADIDCQVVASACPGHSNSGNNPVEVEIWA